MCFSFPFQLANVLIAEGGGTLLESAPHPSMSRAREEGVVMEAEVAMSTMSHFIFFNFDLHKFNFF